MVWRIHQLDLKFTCISTLTHIVFIYLFIYLITPSTLYECWVKNHIVFKEKGKEEKEHPRAGHHGGPRILPQKHFLTLSIFHRQVESKSICCCGRGCVGIVERFENWPSGYVDFITPKSFTSWMTTVSLSFLSSKITDCMIGWFWRSISDRRLNHYRF